MELARKMVDGTSGTDRVTGWTRIIHRTRIVAVAFILVGIIAMVAMAITGWLAVVFKQPNERAIVQTQVCDDVVVKKYNTIISTIESPDDIPTATASLITDFSKSSGYEQDPTCMYIKFSALIQKNDYSEASAIYTQMVKLADGGAFVDSRLYNAVGLSGMKRNLDLIAPVDTSAGDDLRDAGDD